MIDQVIRQSHVALSPRGGIRRRDILRCIPAAAAAAAAFNWTDLIAAQAAQLRRRGKSCILLWMQGGPSQFETFTPKPNHANGGDTEAIETSVAGIRIAANLPRTAEVMDDICIIRSMTSKEGSHPRATYLLHTGYLPSPSVRYPAFGSLTAQQLGDGAAELPNFVRIGRRRGNLVGAGMLGVDYDPFVFGDPRKPPENSQPGTATTRFRRRLSLVKRMDDRFAQRGAARVAGDHHKLYHKAAKMMLSKDMSAFDLAAEPARVREAYGDTDFGSGCLMARRLIESGVTFVEVTLGNWDTHQDNFERSRSLCGQLDQPYAQLLRELKERGRLDDTLVIWMGEFGRTPRINPRAGRDHFPRAFNAALAGCGVRGGQVIGETDPSGNEITARPVTVSDLFQTFCSLLEIDADHENMSAVGRPVKIVDGGEAVSEVMG